MISTRRVSTINILYFSVDRTPRLTILRAGIFSMIAVKGEKCSGKLQPAHLTLESIVSLQELFYGKWTPPESYSTRSHRIGLHSMYRYEPPKPRPKIKPKPRESENKILEIMKATKKPFSPMDMEKKTPWTRNHCGIIMSSLYKQGFLKRRKVALGNTRHYVYEYVKPTQ